MMDKYTTDGKIIVFESARSNILAAITAVVCIFAGLAFNKSYGMILEFWIILLISGYIAAICTYRLLSPKYTFIAPGSAAFIAYKDAEYASVFNDLGIFTYSENGFTVVLHDEVKTFEWNQINTLLGYKTGPFQHDEVVLWIIFTNKFTFEIKDYTPGWHQFLIRIQAQITEFPEDWEDKLATTGSIFDYTVLYDRHQRNINEIIQQESEIEPGEPD